MAYPKGKPRPPGAGRKKGTPNKTTRDLRETIVEAFYKAGGVSYLIEQSTANPQAFMGLMGKVIPKEIEASVTGTITLVNEFTD